MYEARADVVATKSCGHALRGVHPGYRHLLRLLPWVEGEQEGHPDHVIDSGPVLAGKYRTLILILNMLNFIF
jgi:hypothetical protein